MERDEILDLVLIFLIATLLRIFPYINYHHLMTVDAMKEFQQAQYILEFHKVNWNHPYGAFPVLHILVALSYKVFNIIGISISLEQTQMIVPQLLSSLGVIFYYFFLKKFFDKNISLIASLILATFGPNVWWGMQGVRETVGLFFFSLNLYMITLIFHSKNLKNFILSLFSFIFLVMSHHWTTLMFLVAMFTYLLALNIFNRQNGFVFFLYVMITIAYWKFVFPFVFILIKKVLFINYFLVLLVTLLIGIIIISLRRGKRPSLSKILCYVDLILREVATFISEKLNKWIVLSLCIVAIIPAYLLFSRILVFVYPIQEYMSLLLLWIFVCLSVFEIKFVPNNTLLLVFLWAGGYISLIIIGVGVGQGVAFDPLRVVEFLVYPLAPLAALSIVSILANVNSGHSRKKLEVAFVLLFVISGLFIYPPIFIFGNPLKNTVFYDIRSEIRYVPKAVEASIIYSQKESIFIESPNPTYRTFSKTIYITWGSPGLLFTLNDFNVLTEISKVKNYRLGIGNLGQYLNSAKIIKSNNITKIYTTNISSIFLLQKLLIDKEYDSNPTHIQKYLFRKKFGSNGVYLDIYSAIENSSHPYVIFADGTWRNTPKNKLKGWDNEKKVIVKGKSSLAGVYLVGKELLTIINNPVFLFDTNELFVDQNTGSLINLPPGTLVILIGSGTVNLPVGWYEHIGYAPVIIRSNKIITPKRTYTLRASNPWWDVSEDIFIIQVFLGERGEHILIIEGGTIDGTIAGIYYFVHNILPNIKKYQNVHYIIGKWNEKDGKVWDPLRFSPKDPNGFSEGDEIYILETG